MNLAVQQLFVNFYCKKLSKKNQNNSFVAQFKQDILKYIDNKFATLDKQNLKFNMFR